MLIKAAKIAGIATALCIAIHILLFWGGSGTVVDLIRGNMAPADTIDDPGVSFSGGNESTAISVRATIDTGTVLYKVLPEYLSFTLDTSQLVGGKWWNPDAGKVETGSGTRHAPVFDFNRKKLDVLVSGLVPAYLRIGGSEADKVYYDPKDRREFVSKEDVPRGYHQTMTGKQWDNLNAFVRRNGLKFVFTLNSGPSARNSDQSWNPANAGELMRYSREMGHTVDVFELGNEHNLFWYLYGFRKVVSAGQYGKDLLVLRDLMKKNYPDAKLGSQGSAIWPVLGEMLGAFFGFYRDMLINSGRDVDIIAWHYYPQQSRRGPFASRKAHPGRLLEPENLDEAGYWAGVFTKLRDRHAPGRGIWLGETGNAQFGGEPGVSDSYIGGLWWLDQLGLLAASGVEAVFRQTLAGMNYGMMDPETLELNPDYWNSLLWKRLMGTDVYRVLLEGVDSSKVRVYAHSSTPGSGISVLVINLDHRKKTTVSFDDFRGRSMRVFEVTSRDVLGKEILLNGKALEFNGKTLPDFSGRNVRNVGIPSVTVNPLSYTFISFTKD